MKQLKLSINMQHSLYILLSGVTDFPLQQTTIAKTWGPRDYQGTSALMVRLHPSIVSQGMDLVSVIKEKTSHTLPSLRLRESSWACSLMMALSLEATD
jgi:IS1 family transposase